MNFGARFTPVGFFTPSGPPFPATAAFNGLSVDSVTGKIVLGNDVGDPAAPAALVSNREIITEDVLGNLWALNLNSVVTGINTELNGQAVNIVGGNAVAASMSIVTGAAGNSIYSAQAGAGGVAGFVMRNGADSMIINADGTGHIFFRIGLINVWSVNTASFKTQIGPTLVADNGATLQVSGPLTYRELANGFNGVVNVNRDLDSAKCFFNTAAGTLVLPNMVGANSRIVFILQVIVNNIGGVTIQADGSQVMRVGTEVSSAGGTLVSTNVGSAVRLALINSGTWVAEAVTGSWTIT